MRVKDLLPYARFVEDPDHATLLECARIAKELRCHVWEGKPLENKSGIVKRAFLALMPG